MAGSIHDFMMKMARALVDGAPSPVARSPSLDELCAGIVPSSFPGLAPDAVNGGEAPPPTDPITEVRYLPSRTHDQDDPGPLWVEWSQPNDPRSWDLASHSGYSSAEVAALRAEVNRLRDVVYRQSCTMMEPLSASWHHLPCVTAGLPDPRPVHPVAAAIGRQGKAAAPGLVMPRGFE